MKFTIVWDERKSIEVKANSEIEAREKFENNGFPFSEVECNSSEIVEVYKFKI